jgi:hypothetical protein
MALSDTIQRIARPGQLPLEIFLGGTGQSFRRDFQILVGDPSAAEDLTGVTPSAEIRTLDDALLVTMTATVTDAANGWVRVTLTREAADAIEWPGDGPITGKRTIRGRWHLRLDDGTTSMPVIAGDVTVTR